MLKTPFAIISDIHDNLANLEKCLGWCNEQKFTDLICCGDVTNSETLKFLAHGFKNTIHLVKGNAEIYNEEEIELYDNIKYYGQTGKIQAGGQVIGICHEPYLIDKMLVTDIYNIIFYGHTHKPWESTKNNTELINPGTLGGIFQKATFAIADQNGIRLKILEYI